MSRLYLRFYVALLGSLIVFAVAAAAVWHRVGGPVDRVGDALAQLIQNALPPPDAAATVQQASLQQLARNLATDLSLLAADRSLLAAVGQPQQLPDEHAHWKQGLHRRDGNTVWSIHLPDGRWLVAATAIQVRHPAYVLILMLSALALAVGMGAFPIVRRLAQRLERLQRGVESLGAGNLAARVAVEGRDEVAQLAGSFNDAAARIESLVGAHKQLLANASHELRTPLARIRMAVELLKGAAAPKQKAGLEQDIVELDHLIDEILLTSRLDAVRQLDVEDVDLLALAAEECARYSDVQLDGASCIVRGDPHLLRRMLRNLLENAALHGRPPVCVVVSIADTQAGISVSDDGPGVPLAQRERIFEPFFRRAESRNDAGAGLGLALVRQIARRHGGDVRYVSTLDHHGRFVVSLARGDADASSA